MGASVIPALAAGISLSPESTATRLRCPPPYGGSPESIVIPAQSGDLCIISFLPLQGEVPKAEGVLLRQALSGTCASRTPPPQSLRDSSPCEGEQINQRPPQSAGMTMSAVRARRRLANRDGVRSVGRVCGLPACGAASRVGRSLTRGRWTTVRVLARAALARGSRGPGRTSVA